MKSYIIVPGLISMLIIVRLADCIIGKRLNIVCREDCWVAFKGKVYNCTPYMEFHPGGGDELFKSAGEDGTELFNQVHRWVNLERILGPCLIGPFLRKKPIENNFLKLP